MSLSTQDIARIAHLARLSLSESEAAMMHTQINGFFSLVEQMNAVDTTGVEPLHQPLSAIEEVSLRLREDTPKSTDVRADAQRNSPAVAEGLFLVPRVVE
jgi:aspartyl-tRNA(Asn)/glutamyl-tRNA(Gln) amidotransferase subunit C